MANTRIRWATEGDAALIVHFVRALAEYEKEPLENVHLTEADVLRDGFSAARHFEVLIAELDGKAVGFTLFFQRYSTWQGRPGLYIEDIFVDESARGTGIGRKIIAAVAKIAKARGANRIDLSVLNWNPARDFYHRLGFEHAEPWMSYRLSESHFAALADEVADFSVGN